MRDFLQKNRKALSVGFSIACSVFLVAAVVSAATTIGLNITTDGNTTLGDAAASDTVTLNSRFASGLVPNALGTLDVGSYALSWNNIYASGTVFSGNLNASNTLTVSGNSTLGDASTDTVTLNARFASTVSPSTNNARDLGAFGVAWRVLYSSSSLNVGSGAASTTIAATGNIMLSGHILPGSNNASDLGAFATAWRNLYSSSSLNVGSGAASTTIAATGNIMLSGKLLPGANNASDLGAYATAWKDAYVSGTLYADSISTSTIDNIVIGGTTRAAGSFTTVNANGNTTLGDDASADTVTLSSRFASSLIPSASNARDLGTTSSSLAMRSIYASSTLSVGGLAATTTINFGSADSGVKGRGTCIVLSGADSVLYFVSVTTTAPGYLVASTVDCR